jgi:hypothetical protein
VPSRRVSLGLTPPGWTTWPVSSHLPIVPHLSLPNFFVGRATPFARTADAVIDRRGLSISTPDLRALRSSLKRGVLISTRGLEKGPVNAVKGKSSAASLGSGSGRSVCFNTHPDPQTQFPGDACLFVAQ